MSAMLGVACLVQAAAAAAAKHELTGWTSLDQSTRWPGPTSGHFVPSGLFGVATPFPDAQCVPGFSGLLLNEDGTFTAMPDNGFGAKSNSPDYVLGFYNIDATFKTASDGTTAPGTITINNFTAFNDRNGILKNGAGVDLLVSADLKNYLSGTGIGQDSGIPVDERIVSNRWLTGYDLDVESIARAADGTFWVGEEFGPFLLHFDAEGALIEEPVPHPVLRSPYNPAVLPFPATATHPASRGFESLAYGANGRYLYVLPEGAPSVDSLRPVQGDERVITLYQFDPETSSYTGKTWRYQKDGDMVKNAVVTGDMINVGKDSFFLIERDMKFGAEAQIKRVYAINLNSFGPGRILNKRLVVDLLDVSDPRDIGGPLAGVDGELKFNLPLDSLECLVKLGPKEIGVAADTNFPFQDGRTTGTPDSTEFIRLALEKELVQYAPRPTKAVPCDRTL
eukprot:TRINITY_DN2641_c0_g2_i1.p2 TRINITY_DN2641_c0_g2~~TRINITY_DN2641_c0_g2_i1.p2  ORF type:complete len:451 (+),score=189.19 TRINITY_DN2641_c0_g2_i1:61-1413(+)